MPAKRLPSIRVKRVYDPPSPDDGFRVLVDRLWPRGIKKDQLALDLWMKDVAPSDALRKWFGHDLAKWDEFQRRYREGLQQHRDKLDFLLSHALGSGLTLLFAAQDRHHNQAVVLREVLLERAMAGENQTGR
jgi:uncharacterized protein YeaO (DUF488 family)